MERVLHTGGHRDRVGLCGVPVPGLLISPLGLSDRLLHHQGISFSSLERERDREREGAEGIYLVGGGVEVLLCARTLIFRRD